MGAVIRHRDTGADLYRSASTLQLGRAVREALSQRIDLRSADLRDVNLRRLCLRNVDFERVLLSGAQLRETKFPKARLRNVDFRGANLQSVRFWDADLSGADLRGAELQDADFAGAKLVGVLGLPEPDPELPRRVAREILKRPKRFDMSFWHGLQQQADRMTHCLAGWAIALTPHGDQWERRLGSRTAGQLLLPSAAHLFLAGRAEALAWCRAQLCS